MPLTIERNPEPAKSTGDGESQRVREMTQSAGSTADGSTRDAKRSPRTFEAVTAETKVIEAEPTEKPKPKTTARTKATGRS